MSDHTSEHHKWQRLADLISHRRIELGFPYRRDFAVAAGLSDRTMAEIEGAVRTGYLPSTIAKLERGIGWAAGSVRAVLDGGNPVVCEPTFAVSVRTAPAVEAALVAGPDPAVNEVRIAHAGTSVTVRGAAGLGDVEAAAWRLFRDLHSCIPTP